MSFQLYAVVLVRKSRRTALSARNCDNNGQPSLKPRQCRASICSVRRHSTNSDGQLSVHSSVHCSCRIHPPPHPLSPTSCFTSPSSSLLLIINLFLLLTRFSVFFLYTASSSTFYSQTHLLFSSPYCALYSPLLLCLFIALHKHLLLDFILPNPSLPFLYSSTGFFHFSFCVFIYIPILHLLKLLLHPTFLLSPSSLHYLLLTKFHLHLLSSTSTY